MSNPIDPVREQFTAETRERLRIIRLQISRIEAAKDDVVSIYARPSVGDMALPPIDIWISHARRDAYLAFLRTVEAWTASFISDDQT